MQKTPGASKTRGSKSPVVAVTPRNEALERMRRHPQDKWRIDDIRKVCNQLGITCTAPTRGDHYKVSSPALHGILTVPAKRPIKAVYIRKFVALVDAHNEQGAKEQKDG